MILLKHFASRMTKTFPGGGKKRLLQSMQSSRTQEHKIELQFCTCYYVVWLPCALAAELGSFVQASTAVLGTWRNQFGSCFAIQFMVVVSVLDLMALFRSWTFFGKMGQGRILILLDYRFLQNDPELHILLAEMCLQAVMQQHWGPYEEDYTKQLVL